MNFIRLHLPELQRHVRFLLATSISVFFGLWLIEFIRPGVVTLTLSPNYFLWWIIPLALLSIILESKDWPKAEGLRLAPGIGLAIVLALFSLAFWTKMHHFGRKGILPNLEFFLIIAIVLVVMVALTVEDESS